MRRWDFEHKNAICIPNVPREYDDGCLNYTLTPASLCKLMMPQRNACSTRTTFHMERTSHNIGLCMGEQVALFADFKKKFYLSYSVQLYFVSKLLPTSDFHCVSSWGALQTYSNRKYKYSNRNVALVGNTVSGPIKH